MPAGCDTPCHTRPVQPSPELEAIIHRLLRIRRQGDFDFAEELYSRSEPTRVIGSSLDEWADAEALRRLIREDWTTLDVADEVIHHIEAFEHGDTGWAALQAERTTPDGHRFVYRLTFVFVLEAGVWRIVQSHFSVPVSDDVFAAPNLSKSLSDLLEWIDDDGDVEALPTRTATVMFTDIVDSTVLAESLGDAGWSQVVVDHFAALRTAVEGEGGTVVKTLGDGAMFLFDTAGAALRAAAAIRSGSEGLAVRIGVHSGDLVADGGGDVIGSTVAKAARITSAADGGQVLVSATTAGMVNSSEFAFDHVGELELKGLAGTHSVFELR